MAKKLRSTSRAGRGATYRKALHAIWQNESISGLREQARTLFGVGVTVRYRGLTGRVVANIDTDEYDHTRSLRNIRDLGRGVLVSWDDGSITHVREPVAWLSVVVGNAEASPSASALDRRSQRLPSSAD